MRTGIAIVGICLASALAGCPSGGGDAPKEAVFDPYKSDIPADPYENWYPESISPPEGTRYPFLLTPLSDVSTLPGLDQRYVNHVMAQLVAIARANLRLSRDLGSQDQEEALSAYTEFVTEALENIEAEDVPRGMRDFHDDLVAAITLQQQHFEKAAKIVAEHMRPVYERENLTEIVVKSEVETALKGIVGILEGKAASAKLTGAWNKISARYSGHWNDKTRDAIYSHFRAMDL